VTLVTLGLIVSSLTDASLRDWWDNRSLTTDSVSGLLVLLITILVVNQLLNLRQERQRSQAVAAQTAIMMAQAAQRAISSVTGGSGDHNAASDDFRTYTMMLLVSTPVFIDDPAARGFLEQAQDLSGVMAHTLALISRSKGGAAVPSGQLDDAMKQLQSAAAPLLQPLSPQVRASIQRIGQTANE
jgi:hypothetical protein